jgi:hypothetical protein
VASSDFAAAQEDLEAQLQVAKEWGCGFEVILRGKEGGKGGGVGVRQVEKRSGEVKVKREEVVKYVEQLLAKQRKG